MIKFWCMKDSVYFHKNLFWKTLSLICIWVSLSVVTFSSFFIYQILNPKNCVYTNKMCELTQSADKQISSSLILIPIFMASITLLFNRFFLRKHPKVFDTIAAFSLIIGIPVIFIFIKSAIKVLILNK